MDAADAVEALTREARMAFDSTRLARRRATAIYYQSVARLYYRSRGTADVAARLGITDADVRHILDCVRSRSRSGPGQEYEWCCTFCGRLASEVPALHRGPGVAICHECVAEAENARGTPGANGSRWQWTARNLQPCDFCGRGDPPRSVAVMAAASICEDCLRTTSGMTRRE